MKRFALLIVAAVASTATLAQAQVIGTYRPSLVTYYPSATSVTPIAYHRPIPTAGAYGTAQFASNQYGAAQYGAAQYNASPIQTISATQTYRQPAVLNASYAAASPYVVNSPIPGGNCGCAPIQTIASYPAAGCAPAIAQPYAQVAYQQPAVAPYQTIGGGDGYIDGKYYVGKGLLGRPKVYADGQPIRNLFRTILP